MNVVMSRSSSNYFFPLVSLMLILSGVLVVAVLLPTTAVLGSAQISETDRDRQVQGLRRDTVRQINDLLRVEREPSIRFELMRRLGELYIEQATAVREQEYRQFATRHSVWEQREKRGREPQLDNNRSAEMLARGVRVYERMLSEFTAHKELDGILFDLGKVLHESGDERGERYFLRLIEAYPDSELMPETLLAVGEINFERHDMVAARRYYQQLMSFREHRLYPYALYKLGWVFYNLPTGSQEDTLSNIRRGATALTAVVLYAQEAERVSNSAMIDLREEALRDLVVFWSDTRDTEAAWRFFSRVNEPESFYLLLERMAAAYEENGQWTSAISIYRRLLREAPTRGANPQSHARLINVFAEVGRHTEVVQHVEYMNRHYIKSSPWFNANRKDSEVVAKALEAVELTTRSWATAYHKEGIEKRDRASLVLASRLYRLYLSSFETNDHAYDMTFYLADVSFELNQYMVAGSYYLRVVQADGQGKHLHVSAKNAVLAFTEAVAGKNFGKLTKEPHEWEKPQEIPREKRALITGIDTYVTHFSNLEDSYPMRYSAATIYFEYGHVEEAITRYSRLAHELPATPQGISAVRRVVNFYGVQQDWEKVLEHGRGFLAIQGLRDQDLRRYVYSSVVTASFRRAEDFEKEKEYRKAAEAFAEFHAEFPQDPNAARALYNSFVNYQRINDTTNTLAAGSNVLRHFPTFQFNDRVVGAMAEIHERILNFDDASRYYLMFAQRWPNSPQAPRALYNAGVLLRAIEEPRQALRAWQFFDEKFSSHQLASEALYEQAEIYEELGEDERARQLYLTLANRIAATRVNLHAEALAKALLLLPEQTRAGAQGRRELSRLQARLRDRGGVPAPEARKIVSQLMLEDLKKQHEAYDSLDLVTSVDLDQGVQQRQQSLVALVQGYEQLIEIGSAEYMVAALYKIGLAHQQFAEELDRYALLAETQDGSLGDSFRTAATALRNEALEFYKTGYERAGELTVMSPYVVMCYDKMSALEPQQFRPYKQKQLEPGYLITRI